MRPEPGQSMRSARACPVRRDRGGDRGAKARASIMPSRAKLIRQQQQHTVADAIRDRIADDGREWSAGWRYAVELIAKRCEETLGDVPLGGFTLEHAEQLRDTWAATPAAWNQARSVLLTTWRRAQRRHEVPLDRRCPAEAVPNARVARVRWAAPVGHHLELDRAVVEAMRREAISPVLGRALRLLAFTARRPSEITGLAAQGVRTEIGVMHLEKTKIGVPQVVPLQGPALGVAIEAREAALARGSAWLFPQRSDARKPISPRTLNFAWGTVLDVAEELGIETTRSDGRRYLVRDFRPLGITALARGGVQPNVIARIVGHECLATTERYLRLSDDDTRKGQLALFTTMQQTITRTKDDVLATIAGNIKRLRAGKGWTQQRCADGIGVTRQYWYQLEQDGKADVTVLLGVGRLFGVTLEELTGEATSWAKGVER